MKGEQHAARPHGAVTLPLRRIVHRTKGSRHGPITRLMSPGDVGELVKPIVFLDWLEVDSFEGAGFARHPHSGIATHTTLLQGSVDYGDSTGETGFMPAGSVEWMQARAGVWHWGSPRQHEPVRGYQLWLALPAAHELRPAVSQYIDESSIPTDRDGVVQVLLLGRYGAMRSPIPYDEPVTYLHVRLAQNQEWTFDPSDGHDVAWVAVQSGRRHVGGALLERELAVFEEGDGDIAFRADGATEFVVASARKHPHPLVCGYYSVHTSSEALMRGEAHINTVGLGLDPAVLARCRA